MRKIGLLIAAFLALSPIAVNADPILIGGELVGATDVDVLGTLYDVSFVEGTCFDLFDGCDESADFDFTDSLIALSAAQALLNQVFIDSAAGLFDTDPTLTFGCSNQNACETYVPYSPGGSLLYLLAIASNNTGSFFPDVVTPATRPISNDSTLSFFTNFARFTLVQDPTTVPEPGTLALLFIGLAGMGLARRRRKV